MSGRLTGRGVAFLVADEGVERTELTEPWAWWNGRTGRHPHRGGTALV